MQDMTANQPYLLRAFYDWIVDNGLTPYMLVDANFPNVKIPTQFVNDGQIVLNVSPSACVNFNMDVEWVEFQARFSGQPMIVSFPCSAVGAIYAKENGAGSVFTVPDVVDTRPTIRGVDSKKNESNISLTAPLTSGIQKASDKAVGKNDKTENKPTKPPGLRIVK